MAQCLHSKAIENASQLKDHCGGEYFKQKTIIFLVASDTSEFTWNVSKRGREYENKNTIKQLQSTQTIHTRTHINSVQIRRHGTKTATQTRKHPHHYLHGQTRETYQD